MIGFAVKSRRPRGRIFLRRIAVPTLIAALIFAPGFYLGQKWFAGTLNLEAYAVEGGPIEILHVLLIAVATLLFYLSWRQGRGPVRVVGGALTMLAAAALVREADVKMVSQFLGWDWLFFLADHGLQEAALIAMTLPIPLYLFWQKSEFRGVFLLGLRWQAWPLYLAGVLVLACIYLDERVVHGMQMRFWEELIETYSYVFMVMAAWRHWQLVGDPVWDHDGAPTLARGSL
jgi:hypothetical protein